MGSGIGFRRCDQRCKIEGAESYYQRKTESTYGRCDINLPLATCKICGNEGKSCRQYMGSVTSKLLLSPRDSGLSENVRLMPINIKSKGDSMMSMRISARHAYAVLVFSRASLRSFCELQCHGLCAHRCLQSLETRNW